ncbi:ROK family protein [Actinacidiphila acididurans]|uniref:ROK family protein n=1 Tax=Actinacidiphila acididurans TaxID=2784346 RepID=A0ABS2U1X7_9ACTN|nr:ROK family protein [Actinacidiphila acididurans]MBM9509352.1 ROK family protein [Actinacidiphila acididurans]
MTRTAGQATPDVRRHNLRALLRHLHLHGPCTRTGLGEALGLTRSAVADLVAELTRRGLVTESAAARATTAGRGRPSLTVAPDGRRARVLAVDIGVDEIRMALVGLDGSVAATTVLDQVPEPGDPARTLDRLAQAVDGFTAGRTRPLAVGIAVPGLVDGAADAPDGGPSVVSFAPNLDWHQVHLADELRRRVRLEMPVRLGNTCNVAALAELLHGAGRGHRNMLYLYARVGVGAGIIVDGRLLGGPGWAGGEVGHMLFAPGDRPCRCGSSGCWETEVGGDALLRHAGLPAGRGHARRARMTELLERADRGEPQAVDAVTALAPAVATGLSSLQALLGTELIVMGGLFSHVLRHARGTLEDALRAGRSRLGVRRETELLPAALQTGAPLLGAAEIAVEAFLDDLADTAP